MSRFVEVEGNCINVDHIVRVHLQKDYVLEIFLDDGTVIKTDYNCERILRTIEGRDYIVAAVPCEGIDVAMDFDGKTHYFPLRQLAVTAVGEVRPLCVQFDVVEFYDDQPSFSGMVPAMTTSKSMRKHCQVPGISPSGE